MKSIKFQFKLNPATSQVDEAIVYFANLTGKGVREYVRMAVEERTAQLAQALREQAQEQLDAEERIEGDTTIEESEGDVQTSGTQSIQSDETTETSDDTGTVPSS